FFVCSCCPPHLHSFPTRRSSDLDRLLELPQRGGGLLEGMNDAADLVPLFGFDRHQKLFQVRAGGEVVALVADDQPDKIPPHLVQDRKSTRLNSSHGSISYAVFCL